MELGFLLMKYVIALNTKSVQKGSSRQLQQNTKLKQDENALLVRRLFFFEGPRQREGSSRIALWKKRIDPVYMEKRIQKSHMAWLIKG